MGVIWEINLVDFILVTIVLGGGAAYMTGRAVALTWRRLAQLLAYTIALTCAVRFIHYALFGGTLVSLRFFAVDFVILLAWAALGYRVTKTGQMVGQYSWLYERTTPLSWHERGQSG